MDTSNTSTNKFWSWVGKAATLVGLLYGLFQLSNLFKPSEYSIETNGDHVPVSFPRFVYDSLDKFKIPNDIQYELKRIESLWSFHLKNIGSKEARDLNLELPFAGNYSVTRNDQEASSGRFSKIIALGSLRPQNELAILVWSYRESESYFEDQTRITHADGAYTIDYSVPVRGIVAWNHRQYDLPLFGACFVGFLLIVVIAGTSFDLGKKSSQSASKSQTSVDKETDKGETAP